MDVGVRELKAKLSSYLRQAAAGEFITVTERGRPIAVLGPAFGTIDLDAAAEEGWVTLPSGSGLRSVRRHPPTGTVASTLAEDRSE